MENTRTTNEQGLPTVSEESSQVGGHLPQAEESFQVEEGHLPQAERRRAHKNKLSYMFVNLLSLTEFFIAVGATLWNFWCRGFKPLWHWVEVFVEGEYLQSTQPARLYHVADGLLKDFAELYLSVIGTVAIVVYQ